MGEEKYGRRECTSACSIKRVLVAASQKEGRLEEAVACLGK